MPSVPRAVAAALLIGMAAGACTLPFFGDDCEADQIMARFDGAFTIDGDVRDIHREDRLTPTNLPPGDFRHVNQVLIEGQTAVRGVAWSHGGIGTANDFFAIALGAPLRTGETRAVTHTFRGGGWGPFDLGGRDVLFALRLDGAWATGIRGEATVVDAAPLILDLMLTGTLADGSMARLVGTDAFRFVRGTCKDARG